MSDTTTTATGYKMNMAEEQVVTKTELEYSPAIFYRQHQTAPFPARIWIPPFADPTSGNVSPYVRSWLNVVGTNMAAYLDYHNMLRAIHETRFDNWYAGFTDWAGVFRGEISFFYRKRRRCIGTPRRVCTRSTSFRRSTRTCGRSRCTRRRGKEAGGI